MSDEQILVISLCDHIGVEVPCRHHFGLSHRI
jgi:hypothetical protein